MKDGLAQFAETDATESFSLQNAKLLKVRLEDVTINAQLGSMVAYQGDVNFEYSSSGSIGKFIKKRMTGENVKLMKVTGTGEVFLADQGQNVHLIYLENDKLTCNSQNLLAFDTGIEWDIKKVSGGMGAMMAGGLFNTTLEGTGWVAVVSDGPPIRLDVAEAPTFADAQAAITWSSGVTTTVKTDIKLKNFIGRGSGESLQVAFGGEGWVLVQPSEGKITFPVQNA